MTGTATRRTVLKGAAAAAAAAALVPAADAAPRPQKITVVTGSPRRRGTSFLLADEFIRGAKERGHIVTRYDAAFSKVTPCNGCDRCGIGARPCVYKDDMLKIGPSLVEADVVVLCTPLYYFGFSTQIKAVIDRFYGYNSRLHEGKRAVLLATAWNSDDWTMEALATHYRILTRYMGWKDAGRILAIGCGTRADIEASAFPRQAYELGRRI